MNTSVKKLKLNKKFVPIPCDIDDELYPNGIFEFNITKLLVFIEANSDIFQAEKVPVKIARTCPSNNLDELTIKNSDITKPIILAEISPERFNVIDGNHRLEKACRAGVSTILAYRISPDHHVAFLTSVMAYEEYVAYWNSKIKSMYYP